MGEAALVAWIVTAAGGLLLYLLWTAGGGLRQQAEDTEPPTGRTITVIGLWQIVTHGSMALVGLFLWAVYLAKSDDPGSQFGAAPWLTVGLLLFVAGLGLSMYRNWHRNRPARRSPERPADQRLAAPIVYLHGLAALTTLVLVVLVALEVD